MNFNLLNNSTFHFELETGLSFIPCYSYNSLPVNQQEQSDFFLHRFANKKTANKKKKTFIFFNSNLDFFLSKTSKTLTSNFPKKIENFSFSSAKIHRHRLPVGPLPSLVFNKKVYSFSTISSSIIDNHKIKTALLKKLFVLPPKQPKENRTQTPLWKNFSFYKLASMENYLSFKINYFKKSFPKGGSRTKWNIFLNSPSFNHDYDNLDFLTNEEILKKKSFLKSKKKFPSLTLLDNQFLPTISFQTKRWTKSKKKKVFFLPLGTLKKIILKKNFYTSYLKNKENTLAKLSTLFSSWSWGFSQKKKIKHALVREREKNLLFNFEKKQKQNYSYGNYENLTYSSEFYIPVQMTDQISKKMYLGWFLLVDLLIQTKRGHFIVNGYPKTIVHQILRSPGIRFKNTNNQILADIIAIRGAWMGIQILYEKIVKVSSFQKKYKNNALDDVNKQYKLVNEEKKTLKKAKEKINYLIYSEKKIFYKARKEEEESQKYQPKNQKRVDTNYIIVDQSSESEQFNEFVDDEEYKASKNKSFEDEEYKDKKKKQKLFPYSFDTPSALIDDEIIQGLKKNKKFYYGYHYLEKNETLKKSMTIKQDKEYKDKDQFLEQNQENDEQYKDKDEDQALKQDQEDKKEKINTKDFYLVKKKIYKKYLYLFKGKLKRARRATQYEIFKKKLRNFLKVIIKKNNYILTLVWLQIAYYTLLKKNRIQYLFPTYLFFLSFDSHSIFDSISNFLKSKKLWSINQNLFKQWNFYNFFNYKNQKLKKQTKNFFWNFLNLKLPFFQSLNSLNSNFFDFTTSKNYKINNSKITKNSKFLNHSDFFNLFYKPYQNLKMNTQKTSKLGITDQVLTEQNQSFFKIANTNTNKTFPMFDNQTTIHETLFILFFVSSPFSKLKRGEKQEKKEKLKVSGFTFLSYLFDHPYFLYNNSMKFWEPFSQILFQNSLNDFNDSRIFWPNFEMQFSQPHQKQTKSILYSYVNKMTKKNSSLSKKKEKKKKAWSFAPLFGKFAKSQFFKPYFSELILKNKDIGINSYHQNINENFDINNKIIQLKILDQQKKTFQPYFFENTQKKLLSLYQYKEKLISILNINYFRNILFERFFNPKYYDIGLMGRKHLNKKLRLNIPVQCTTLTSLDFLAIFYKLFSVHFMVNSSFPIDQIGLSSLPSLEKKNSKNFQGSLALTYVRVVNYY